MTRNRSRTIAAVVLTALLVVSIIPAGAMAAADQDRAPLSAFAPVDSGNETRRTVESLNLNTTSAQKVNGTVYVGSFDNNLYALNADTGDVKWSYTAGAAIDNHPTVAGGTVYFGANDGSMYAVNAETGDEEWVFSTSGGYARSPPTIINGSAYFATSTGSVYSVNTSTGTEEWSFATNGQYIQSSPTVVDGAVYIGSDDHQLYRLNAETGTEEWSYTLGGEIESSPIVYNDSVYVGSLDSNVYAINAETGTEEWSYTTGDSVRSSPTVVNDSLYIGSDDNNLYALNAETGKDEWSYTTGGNVRSSPTVADGSVYVGSYDDYLHAVNADTGTEEWSYQATNVIKSSPTYADGIVYIGSSDSNLYAINAETGTQEWQYSTGDDINSAPTIVSNGSNRSDGSRVLQRTLGHHEGSWSGSGASVSGQVTSQNGSGLEGATVTISQNGSVIKQTTTDASGEFSTNLEDGNYTIEATKSGYSDSSTTVTVAGSDITGVNFTLQGHLLEGTVTDRTGEPIADASVTILNDSTDDTVERLVTDSSGRYEFQLTENGTYRVRAVHDNVQANKTVNYTTPGETVNLQIDKYYASGDVTVVNASGELIDNQSISLDFSSTESDYETSWGMSDGYAKLDDAFDDASHPNNETYELTVSTSGYRNRTVMVNDTKGSYTVTLNDENSSHWSQEVNLIDHTGLFDMSESYLIVEASDSDSPGWEIVDGTHFALSEPTIQIREGVTYRLYVQNENGDRATAGELVPEDWSDDPDHVVTVTVGSEDSDNPVDRNEGDDDDDSVHYDSPPIADFEVSTDNPIVGEEVALNGTLSRDLESGVQSYRWHVDGEQVATGATPTWTPSDNGVHEITLEVEDDQGQTDSESKSVFVGANDMFTLYIRDQANPEELINGTNVTVSVTFYSGNETITRTTSDGSVDLTGLPADETLVATARADGWQNRRILIRDITRQQSIYLFRDNTSAAEVTFLLEDKTGNFPSTSSQLIIQRSMNYSGTSGSEWQTVLGDYFAADQSFTATLETGQRYRLIIRNDEGDQRVLGSYIAEESETTTLTIGTIVWDPGDDENVQFDARLRQDEDQLRLEYNDSAQTDRLEITVYERGNESNVIYETTEHNIGEYVETLPLTDNESDMNLVVEVYGNRSGEDFNSTVQLGEVPEQPLPIDSRWLSLMGQVLIVATTGLVAGVLHRTGGIIVVSMAFVLSWFGWVVIHPAALGFAGFLALFSAVKPLGGG